MPHIYKKYCRVCKKYSESPAKYYCSNACFWSDKELFIKTGSKFKGKRFSPRTEFKKGHSPAIPFKKGEHFSKDTEFKKGQVPYNYKGVSPIGKLIRDCDKYKQWRGEIFIRDGYQCQLCYKKGGDLNVDHIIPFSVILLQNTIESVDMANKCNELWNLSNGRTLCISCHRKTKTYSVKPENYISKYG